MCMDFTHKYVGGIAQLVRAAIQQPKACWFDSHCPSDCAEFP